MDGNENTGTVKETQVEPAIRSRCATHSGCHAMGADCWLCRKLWHASRFLGGDADDPHDDATEAAIGLLAADVVLREVREFCIRKIRAASEADKRSNNYQETERLSSYRGAMEDVLSAIHVAMSEQCQLMGR